MKSLIFLLFLSLNLAFANSNLELIKGQAAFLEFDKKDLIKINANDKTLSFFPHPKDNSKVLAIFALPYKNPPKSTQISAIYKDKTQKFEIKTLNGAYKSEKITANPSKVFPPKKAQARIKKELEEANLIYAKFSPKALYDGAFQRPLDSFITSDFGKARVFNEKLASYHSGTDFRAQTPTPIAASNTGVVVIAKDRYYAGNSVVIDHGFGIYTQYYHLSRIDVKVGQSVAKGEILGLSGASGRVSGPHLHFGVFAGGKQVDPLDFIAKFNAILQ